MSTLPYVDAHFRMLSCFFNYYYVEDRSRANTGVTTNSATATNCVSWYDLRGGPFSL